MKHTLLDLFPVSNSARLRISFLTNSQVILMLLIQDQILRTVWTTLSLT